MAFEAGRNTESVASEAPPEAEARKRAMLGKIAEDAVIELRGHEPEEGEIFSKDRVAESMVRHEAQTFMQHREAEISAETAKLQAEANITALAEAQADALLLKQTRAELARSSLDVPAENSIEQARKDTGNLITEAMHGRHESTMSLEGAVSPVSPEQAAVQSPEARTGGVAAQITRNELSVRHWTNEQFTGNPQLAAGALERIDASRSRYAELVPLQKQELPLDELAAIARQINFEGLSLAQLLETHQLDEAAVRRVVAEFLTGGDTEAAIRREKENHEAKYERDPHLRNARKAGKVAAQLPDAQLLGKLARKSAAAKNQTGTKKLVKAKSQPKAKPAKTTADAKTKTKSVIKRVTATFSALNVRQLITVCAVALFMVALIFLALALTR